MDFEVFGQKIGRDRLFLIGGPCVIESEEIAFEVACFLKNTCERLKIPFVFKSSYDKANRTSALSFRGPGLEKGLDILARMRESTRFLSLPMSMRRPMSSRSPGLSISCRYPRFWLARPTLSWPPAGPGSR